MDKLSGFYFSTSILLYLQYTGVDNKVIDALGRKI